MSETETLVLPEISEAEVLVLELCDSKPSGYVMDGPGNEDTDLLDTTAVISFPSFRWIRNVSRIKVKEGKTFIYKKIRYIAGCPFIEVERQEKEGYKPNPMTDKLFFRGGTMRVVNEGDIAKFQYLKLCEYNTSAPNRPDDAQDVFKVINTAIDAGIEESDFDLEAKAMAILGNLKKKVNAKEFLYNDDQMEFLCSLFKVAKPESGYKSEAWVALATIAKGDPGRFINSIANVQSLVEHDVFSAVQLKVVEIDQHRAFFAANGKLIMKFDQDTEEKQKGVLLVEFMSNPKNELFYKQLRMQVKEMKDNAVAPIT